MPTNYNINLPMQSATITGPVTVNGNVGVVNGANQLAINPDGSINTNANQVIPVVSVGNSTTAQLGPSAVFTGAGEDVSRFVNADVSILSDQASAIDGVSFQFSEDGTTWNFPLTFTVIANQGLYFSVAPRAQYFRLVYTNGAVATTTLAIAIVYYGTARSTYQADIDIPVLAGQGAEVVKAILSAQNNDSTPQTYTNLIADPDTGALLVTSPGEDQTEAGNAFIYNYNPVSANGNETMWALIINPSGSSTNLSINTRKYSGYNTALINLNAIKNVYMNPSVANGLQTVNVLPDVSNSLQSKWFPLSTAPFTYSYYVWFNVGGGGTDPHEAGTGIEVDFATNSNANTVGTAIASAINAGSGGNFIAFGANPLTIENTFSGPFNPSTGGNTGFTFTMTSGLGNPVEEQPNNALIGSSNVSAMQYYAGAVTDGNGILLDENVIGQVAVQDLSVIIVEPGNSILFTYIDQSSIYGTYFCFTLYTSEIVL